MEAQSGWRRVVRPAAVVAVVGLLAWLAPESLAAAKAKAAEGPSYVLSNMAAIVMCIVAIAIPCKRYYRT
ncbi:MAG: hypothetical protein NT049_12285 [Planctomycetota bacterium]|nr:hypothetical protein [Planctomycetota bacterium]